MKRGTIEHPKLKKLAKSLDISTYAAVGLLECLWHFTARYAQPGDVGKYSNDEIALGLYWEGDPDELVNALVANRWIDEHPEFRLVVHDWHEHADQTLKRSLAKQGLVFASEKLAQTSLKLAQTSLRRAQTSSPEPEPEPEPEPSQSQKDISDEISCTELSGDSPRAGDEKNPDSNTQVILTFPTNGTPPTWDLTWGKVREYENLWPGLDVHHECQKAKQWCVDNPKRRKSARGMTRFLNSWMERANNSGRAKFKDQSPRASPNAFGVIDPTVPGYEPSDWTPEELELLKD